MDYDLQHSLILNIKMIKISTKYILYNVVSIQPVFNLYYRMQAKGIGVLYKAMSNIRQAGGNELWE